MTRSILLKMVGVGGGGLGTEGDLVNVSTCVGCHREVIYHGSVTVQRCGLRAVMMKCCLIQVRHQDNCIHCKNRKLWLFIDSHGYKYTLLLEKRPHEAQNIFPCV